jgi:hypothetical protein
MKLGKFHVIESWANTYEEYLIWPVFRQGWSLIANVVENTLIPCERLIREQMKEQK